MREHLSSFLLQTLASREGDCLTRGILFRAGVCAVGKPIEEILVDFVLPRRRCLIEVCIRRNVRLFSGEFHGESALRFTDTDADS